MRDLLWAKFWVGTLPLLVLAVGIVGVTDWLLQVTDFMFFVSVLTIVLMTFALAGLALGFGTIFPQFETENAAQIPTSFGGLLYMMTSIVVIGGVITLEARPVYGYLSARTYGTPTEPLEMIVGFGLAALLCVAATVVPVKVALRRLEAVER
jgi:ABC-2 type transport system permease protein